MLLFEAPGVESVRPKKRGHWGRAERLGGLNRYYWRCSFCVEHSEEEDLGDTSSLIGGSVFVAGDR